MDTISPAPASLLVPRATPRLSRSPDETLALLAGKGNEDAFAALYERYHQLLYRYCRSIVGNHADAQDALQSAFANGLAALQRGQRKAPVRPWLFRIAHNEAISSLRRRRFSGADLSDAPTELACSAEERAAERARLAQLVADLAELPERARGALLMRELSGLSHDEIAIALETSVGAAKQAIFDGRQALYELAEGRAMACEEIRRQISDGDGRALRGRRLRAHLRDCGACSAFAAAIPARRENLRALVPPLPVAASSALLWDAMTTASSNGVGAKAVGTGSVASGALGKVLGTSIASKAVAGATMAAVAAAGAGGVTAVLAHVASSPPAHSGRVLHSGSSGRGGESASLALPSHGLTSQSGGKGIVTVGRTASTSGHAATLRVLPGRGASAGTSETLLPSGAATPAPGKGSQQRGSPWAGSSSPHGTGPKTSPRGVGQSSSIGVGPKSPKGVGDTSSRGVRVPKGGMLGVRGPGQAGSANSKANGSSGQPAHGPK